MIAKDKELLMHQVINAFEQGEKDTKYDVIYIYHDGPGKIRQITVSFGITEYGNLKKLIVNYINAQGALADKFKPYVDKIGKTALVDDDTFKSLIIQAARDEQLMRDQMEDVYEEQYFDPAYTWFTRNGFTTNLSMMVCLDTFIHSGSFLSFLLRPMTNKLPIKNITQEKAWIKEYVKARRQWLATASNSILHGTVYRMDFMNEQISNNNWTLDTPFVANDVKFS